MKTGLASPRAPAGCPPSLVSLVEGQAGMDRRTFFTLSWLALELDWGVGKVPQVRVEDLSGVDSLGSLEVSEARW